MNCKKIILIFTVISILVLQASAAWSIRLKDIASFEGVRANQLIGYGLVVGLNGTGDKSGTTFTIQSLVNMLKNMGIQVSPQQVRIKNVAAVMVTADLPPFAKAGSKIDVLISSLGDATSLQGGTLLATPLSGMDKKVYAVAQGPISIGGFAVAGAAAGIQKNHPTVGRIVQGALVEREVPIHWSGKHKMTLKLNQPDFTTARRIAELINKQLRGSSARPLDSATVKFIVPDEFRENLAIMVADLEKLEVIPDSVAKVIIDERTGTIVIGENVRISTVAVAHGALSIQIRERAEVSQPPPLAPRGAETVVVPETEIEVQEEAAKLLIIRSEPTINDLIRALNAIGVTPRDLIVIFQAIKAAGALHAKLEII
ncbi:MAG: flagellar basal body P-ring protein FlgI [Deltaproteobacteria bacterium]|nr:flagellar basal body P-ring protein FlgI [Deltaproteobacteria bacterium]MBW2050818.1 flagellar basal body P-ring protein FlgI [Deltaproteobacteria bacterium]MBW2141026.1 flagellar basal body P-ring protein FlgI [Deltaproteobacteria bacterium]MBW2322968.1 flagellar basal body P-ring protein FlgI [Deltaproteobacteria bacterium]